MNRKLVTLFFLCGASMVNAQTMKETLLELASECHNAWKGEEDVDENGNKIEYGSIMLDVPNGYVETSGGWPTCGCGCKVEAAAFKDINNQYTYLKYEEWNCSDYGKSSSTRDIKEIMPEGFGLETFTDYHIECPIGYSFQVKFNIPRSGTEMEVVLGVLPLGSVPNDVNGLTYESTTEFNTTPALSCVSQLSWYKEIDENTYMMLLEGKYDDVPANQKKDIDKILSSNKVRSKELCLCLMDLKAIYDIYQSMDCVNMVLKWNKQTSRFDIKTKGERASKCTFYEFLKKVVQFASPRC